MQNLYKNRLETVKKLRKEHGLVCPLDGQSFPTVLVLCRSRRFEGAGPDIMS